MVIGRSEDRGQPVGPIDAQTSSPCLGPDPRTPSGPAVIRPHHKAGHMTALDQTIALQGPCGTGAVHIWVPAFAGKTNTPSREAPQ
jgi:hypothetical protein